MKSDLVSVQGKSESRLWSEERAKRPGFCPRLRLLKLESSSHWRNQGLRLCSVHALFARSRRVSEHGNA
eukprot:3932840-Rhodomonas_salina.2